jgi:Protein of unknown function (DUF1573)
MAKTFVCLVAGILLGATAAVGLAQTSGGAESMQLPQGLSSDAGNGDTGLTGLTGGMSSEPPAVTAIAPVYDFGAVFQGTAVKHTFRIENHGAGPLTLGAVQTSCGCTVAQPTKRLVQPGDFSEIAAVFDTSADKGPAQRIITVPTNDPKHKQISLTIKGDVKVKVDANPTPLVFDKVKHGAEESRQVLVTDTVGGPFKIKSITNSSPNLKVTQQPRTDGHPGAILVVTVLKSMPAAAFSDVIKVATNVAPLNIPVSGTVLGDLNVTPAQVSFGIVKHHAGALRFARLSNAGDRAVRVIGVSSNNQKVTAMVEPVTPGKEFKITLQLAPNSPDGTLRGVVAIKTDDPAQPLVQVPFYGIVGGFNG